jgi:hypothetical protein
MRTKKTSKAEVGNLPGFRQTPEEAAERETKEATKPAETRAKERFQLSFDLNEDGTPDLAAMRQSTKERVQAFFSDPAMAKVFGAKAPAQPEVQIFHPSMVAGLYAMLGSIEAMAVARLTKIPEPICKQVFTYTPPEVEALTGPTVRVLNKYVADWMIKYQDEIALITLLGSLTITKVNAAMTLAKMQAANIPPNGSQAKSEENTQKEGPVQ